MKDLFEIKKLLLANNFIEVKEDEFEIENDNKKYGIKFINSSHKFVAVYEYGNTDNPFVEIFPLTLDKFNTAKNCMYWLIGVLLKEKIVKTLIID